MKKVITSLVARRLELLSLNETLESRQTTLLSELELNKSHFDSNQVELSEIDEALSLLKRQQQ